MTLGDAAAPHVSGIHLPPYPPTLPIQKQSVRLVLRDIPPAPLSSNSHDLGHSGSLPRIESLEFYLLEGGTTVIQATSEHPFASCQHEACLADEPQAQLGDPLHALVEPFAPQAVSCLYSPNRPLADGRPVPASYPPKRGWLQAAPLRRI